MNSAKTICLLSLSNIASDPRVRRQGDALFAAGWNVVGLGIRGGSTTDGPRWPVVTGPPDDTIPKDLLLELRRRLGRYRILQWVWRLYVSIRVRLRPAYALREYWSRPDPRRFYAASQALKANVWVANDWIMLPLAARLATEMGGVYAYDSHEFALNEYMERLSWRLIDRPFVRAIEGAFIHEAARISTVSHGISEQLRTHYSLKRTPVVIRNTPPYQPAPFRPTGEMVGVLYHGLVTPGRGLEATIDSVPAWRSEFSLTIRGPGNPDYLHSLRERIARRRLEDRIELVPPVPMPDLVRAACAFDVGVIALPRHSLQNSYALPNKLFEYMMAGLALCVSNLPEMAALVTRYDVGVLIARAEPDSIADAINRLDQAAIDEYKQHALAAARELSWDRESERMLRAYDGLVATDLG